MNRDDEFRRFRMGILIPHGATREKGRDVKMTDNFDLITMGEVLLRLCAPSGERLAQSDMFEKWVGGAELNVATGVSLLGLRAGMISKLPNNALGTYVSNRIRTVGVSDECLIWDEAPGARLGLYYYENSAAPRKPKVIYDRAGSSMTRLATTEIAADLFGRTRMLHTSGITLALGEGPRKTAIDVIRAARAAGAQISFDVNYRANLWSEEEAAETVRSILTMTDILFVSEETCRRMFHKTGTLREMLTSFCGEYGVKIVASTKRVVHNPHCHDFSSVLYESGTDTVYEEEPYREIEVTDRIGSGDAYCAGVLFGLLRYGDPQRALEFGNAMAAVKCTVLGDLPDTDCREIERTIHEHQGDGPRMEMDR